MTSASPITITATGLALLASIVSNSDIRYRYSSMQVKGDDDTLDSVFINRRISVPEFQRNYSWTKDNIDQFVDDIFSTADEEEVHFWGPIVFLQLNGSTERIIVDGQQRISTVMIMLALLRDKAFEPSTAPNAPTTLASLLSTIMEQQGPAPMSKPKFTSGYLIKDVFNDYILANPDSPPRPKLTPGGAGLTSIMKKNTKELRSAYFKIKSRLEEEYKKFDDDGKRLDYINRVHLALTRDFQIFRIDLVNEKDAYVLFESLNSLGRPLDPSDLLKTLFLKSMSGGGVDHEAVKSALSKWDEMSESLLDFPLSKFLRHYLLSIQDDKVKKSDIYTAFEGLLRDKSPGEVQARLDSLKAAALIYGKILSKIDSPDFPDFDSTIQKSCSRMNVYHESHRFFVLGVVGSIVDIDSQQKLVRAVEALTFRWDLKGNNAQLLETFLQKQLNDFRKSPNPETVDAMLAAINNEMPYDRDIENLFWNQTDGLQKYLLYRLAEIRGIPLKGLAHLHLEHLAPQKPSDDSNWYEVVSPEFPVDEEGAYETYCKSFGNVTLLEAPLNQSIRNAIWAIKVKGQGKFDGLNASHVKITKDLVKEKEWTKDDIEVRGKWMMECAKVLTGRDWIKTGQAKIPVLELPHN